MEAETVLHQALVRRRGTPATIISATDRSDPAGEENEYAAFSFGRIGLKPQLTLVLRFADGRGRGFPYAQLLGLDFDDENAGFRVEFPGAIVEVRGRNLKRLLRYVCDHRAARIEESTLQQSVAAGDVAEIVDAIHIRRVLINPVKR